MTSLDPIFSANLGTVTLTSIREYVDNLIVTGLKLPRELDVWLSPADFSNMTPDFQLSKGVFDIVVRTTPTKMTYYVSGHELHLNPHPQVQLGTIVATDIKQFVGTSKGDVK